MCHIPSSERQQDAVDDGRVRRAGGGEGCVAACPSLQANNQVYGGSWCGDKKVNVMVMAGCVLSQTGNN